MEKLQLSFQVSVFEVSIPGLSRREKSGETLENCRDFHVSFDVLLHLNEYLTTGNRLYISFSLGEVSQDAYLTRRVSAVV